ncbi:MAG: hypothetical protein R6V22_10070 [Rhodohalobacter sp.]|uniref:hypothetical protein n=1 Tax=Rhodohalobacter sp. TaxID=1974210 RepID=UPI003976E2D6
MRKVPKISLIFCLAGFIALLSGSAFGSEIQKEFSTVHTELTSASDGDALLYSTPFPVLLLSEIEITSDSEIEPNESDTAFFLPTVDLRFENKEYLKKSRQVLISLTVRDLIFPFHTHL